jgi:hypothetical protein
MTGDDVASGRVDADDRVGPVHQVRLRAVNEAVRASRRAVGLEGPRPCVDVGVQCAREGDHEAPVDLHGDLWPMEGSHLRLEDDVQGVAGRWAQ